jgi:hypothetical protein
VADRQTPNAPRRAAMEGNRDHEEEGSDTAMEHDDPQEERDAAGHAFVCRQRIYRDDAARFFLDAARYARLERLVIGGEKLGAVIFYYVKQYRAKPFVSTAQGVYCMCDEYRNAIANYKKRYYNFESREGVGDMVWEGRVNPRVLVCEARGSLALPLPRLVALQWFIRMDFDLFFWSDYDEVYASFLSFSADVKRRYTETHKDKKRASRARIETEVIRAREEAERQSAAAVVATDESSNDCDFDNTGASAVSPTTATPAAPAAPVPEAGEGAPPPRKKKKTVHLTRAERRVVSVRLQDERAASRELKRTRPRAPRMRQDADLRVSRGTGLGGAVHVECTKKLE